MRKFYYLLFGVFCLFSCNSSFDESSSIKSKELNVKATEEIAVLTTDEVTTKSVLLPVGIGTEVDNGRVVVTFMQTARPYFLHREVINPQIVYL